MSQLYEAVLDRPPHERRRFLSEACAGDTGLLEEIESLLDQDTQQSPLDRPVWVSSELRAEVDIAGQPLADYNAPLPHSMLLAAGSRLGPYEIQSAIGSGGMGEVYRGTDTRLDRAVAIKILKPGLASDVTFRARFDREARTISHLDHPNICTLYDIGEEGATAFLVMQYLEGSPLSDQIRRGPAPLDDVLRTGISLASALTYAHGRGILHRDVKPQNVLVLADGRVKLLDFGIAKPYGVEADTTGDTSGALTRFGQALGTLDYMSPEQLSGRPIDGRSDMFSLGILLYEMASGRHPFRGETPALTASAILDARYHTLPTAVEAHGALDRVLSRMLASSPADRYPTMADCLADLRELGQHSMSGEKDRAAASPRRRGMWSAPAIATAVGVIVAVAAVSWWSFTRPPQPIESGADVASVATPPAAQMTYWLDVETPAGRDGAPEAFQSLGDQVFATGSRFRINLAVPPGHVYVVGEEGASPDNPTGLSLLYTASDADPAAAGAGARRVTTDWLVFTGPPARDRLWLIWSAAPIEELAAVASATNLRDRGVRDAPAAARVRELLAGSGSRGAVTRDAAATRATITGAEKVVVYRLELQHG